MPYAIRKRSGSKPWAVVNTDTGDVKGTHASQEAAQRQINLLSGVEHGWKPSFRKKG